MSTLDWGALTAAADDAGFSAIPANEYDLVVATAEVARTNANNEGGAKDQIKVKFKVENGPHAGKAVFTNFVLSPENPNALGFFFRHMAALGLTREYFQGNPPLTQVAAALVGRRCRGKVSIRLWNEEERNQIDKILPPIGAATGPIPAAPGSAPPVPQVPVPGPTAPVYTPAPGAVPATTLPQPGVPPVPQVAMPMPVAVPPTPQVPPTPVPTPQPAAAPVAATQPATTTPPPPLAEAVPGASDDLPF